MSFPTFQQEDLLDDKIIVVDVFTESCGPCKSVAPDIERISRKFSGAKFFKLDADRYSKQADKWKINTLPTFLFFKHGKLIDRVNGAYPKKVQSILEELC
jgi:thioredoxin 1